MAFSACGTVATHTKTPQEDVKNKAFFFLKKAVDHKNVLLIGTLMLNVGINVISGVWISSCNGMGCGQPNKRCGKTGLNEAKQG